MILFANSVRDCDAVSGGVNVGVVGAHRAVDLERAVRHHFEAALFEERRVRLYAEREHDGVGLHAAAAGQHLFNLLRSLYAFELRSGEADDAVVGELALDVGRDLGVEARKYLLRHVYYGDLDALGGEVLRDLEADEARAADDRALYRAGVEQLAQSYRVLGFSHDEDVFEACARKLRDYRRSADGYHELVVFVDGLLAGLDVRRGHGLGGAVERHGLFAREHLRARERGEFRRSVDDERSFVRYHAADVVRQAAAGVRNIFVLSEHRHLSGAVLAL